MWRNRKPQINSIQAQTIMSTSVVIIGDISKPVHFQAMGIMWFWIYIKVTLEWYVTWPQLKIFIHDQISAGQHLAPKQMWSMVKFKILLCRIFSVLMVFLGWFCNFLQMDKEECKKNSIFHTI